MKAVGKKKHEDLPDEVKVKLPESIEDIRYKITELMKCPICLETITDAYCNPDCSHHFCGSCIKQSLQDCNHECPICRIDIRTPRALRKDPEFDDLIQEIQKLMYASSKEGIMKYLAKVDAYCKHFATELVDIIKEILAAKNKEEVQDNYIILTEINHSKDLQEKDNEISKLKLKLADMEQRLSSQPSCPEVDHVVHQPSKNATSSTVSIQRNKPPLEKDKLLEGETTIHMSHSKTKSSQLCVIQDCNSPVDKALEDDMNINISHPSMTVAVSNDSKTTQKLQSMTPDQQVDPSGKTVEKIPNCDNDSQPPQGTNITCKSSRTNPNNKKFNDIHQSKTQALLAGNDKERHFAASDDGNTTEKLHNAKSIKFNNPMQQLEPTSQQQVSLPSEDTIQKMSDGDNNPQSSQSNTQIPSESPSINMNTKNSNDLQHSKAPSSREGRNSHIAVSVNGNTTQQLQSTIHTTQQQAYSSKEIVKKIPNGNDKTQLSQSNIPVFQMPSSINVDTNKSNDLHLGKVPQSGEDKGCLIAASADGNTIQQFQSTTPDQEVYPSGQTVEKIPNCDDDMQPSQSNSPKPSESPFTNLNTMKRIDLQHIEAPPSVEDREIHIFNNHENNEKMTPKRNSPPDNSTKPLTSQSSVNVATSNGVNHDDIDPILPSPKKRKECPQSPSLIQKSSKKRKETITSTKDDESHELSHDGVTNIRCNATNHMTTNRSPTSVAAPSLVQIRHESLPIIQGILSLQSNRTHTQHIQGTDSSQSISMPQINGIKDISKIKNPSTNTCEEKNVKQSMNDGDAPLGKVVDSDQKHNTGRWSKEEHDAFSQGAKEYGSKVASKVQTRNASQTRNHAQACFRQMQQSNLTDEKDVNCLEMKTNLEAKKTLDFTTATKKGDEKADGKDGSDENQEMHHRSSMNNSSKPSVEESPRAVEHILYSIMEEGNPIRQPMVAGEQNSGNERRV